MPAERRATYLKLLRDGPPRRSYLPSKAARARRAKYKPGSVVCTKNKTIIFKIILRDGPISRVLSCAAIYLRLPSPIGSSVIHGDTRAGNP